MKLHEALRKVIRHFGINVIEEKRLMSFLADYKAFDDYPALKEVMRAIATGDSGKKICLAADGSDEEFLRLAAEIKETLVREKTFKEEFARYAMDSVSFALGIVSNVTEPGDHGFDEVQNNADTRNQEGVQGNSRAQGNLLGLQVPSAGHKNSSVDILDSVPDGASSHRHFYRGQDITYAFDNGSFSKSVADGTFHHIFPGDYIIKKITVPAVANTETSTYDVKFVIADLDAAINQGNPRVTAHHAVIVPDEPVFDTYMNNIDTNEGGYAGSYMHKTVMPYFALGLIGAFGAEHLLKCSFDGADSVSSDPLSCTCRLMTLSMVFGQTPPWFGYISWSVFDRDLCLGGTQFAAFRLHPDLQSKGMGYWLSDKSYPNDFAFTYNDGRVGVSSHSETYSWLFWYTHGVRPFALLV